MVIARPVALMAQSDNSSITGTITDSSGAVVERAEITVISELTGAEHKTISNRSGFYTIAGLAPGKYTVKVVAPSFHMVTMTNNNLDPAVPATVNIALVVGATNQQVEITANETTLQADSSTLGRVITSSQADNLTVNGRNPVYLALTKAGITSIASNVSTFSFSTGLGSLNINGGRERDNLLTYDGAVAVRIRASGDSIGTPDLDAVQEVQVLATNYPAEYGRSIGGQVRIITKSGGEKFHGSLYEYFQNPGSETITSSTITTRTILPLSKQTLLGTSPSTSLAVTSMVHSTFRMSFPRARYFFSTQKRSFATTRCRRMR